MFRRTALTLTALAAVLTGAAAPAPAAKKPVAHAAGGAEGDLKCMLIASALSQNQDPKARNMSSLMVFYYLGRLDVRSPGLDLGTALRTEAQSVKPAEMQAEGQRCVTALNLRAKALQSLGGSAPGPAPAAAPPPAAPAAPPATAPATPAPH